MVTASDNLATVLFGKTRRAVLALLFTRPTEEFYLRQMVRLTGVGLGPVQRELAALCRGRIVCQDRQGLHVVYRANTQCPGFAELSGLVIKTMGVADVLRAAIEPLTPKIRLAFIFGSFARREQHEQSDVDLFVVSDELELRNLVKALKPAQLRLGREINPVLYTREEYDSRLRTRHHFLTRVLREPTIGLIGERHEP